MKLSELSPRWIGVDGFDGKATAKTGVSFLCPHCLKQRIGIQFKPYIDPDNLFALKAWAFPCGKNPNTGAESDVKFWNRISGESFDDMTLSQSVDLSQYCHWHGHITDGEIK